MIELTPHAVRTWFKEMCTGEIHYTKVLDGKVDKGSFDKLRKIISALCKEKNPVCEPLGRRDGYYRPIEETPEPIDWQGVDSSKDFPIVLPFDLRKYVWIDPDTTIVVAGSKDSCKTGLLMRTVALNMNHVNTVFLSNMEGGVNQIKRRFGAMDIDIPNPAPFQVHHITDNYHDAIKESDTLYVIDYIDVPDSGEFFMIAPSLARIQKKLVNSVAMVALQKRVGSDTAFGGEQTLKKAGLYIAMNPGKLKIVSAKIPTDPKVIPRNMQWTFKHTNEGTTFTDITPFYGD